MKQSPAPFKVGDTVRLKTGKSRILVLDVRFHRKKGWFIEYNYFSSPSIYLDGKWRTADHFVLIENKPEPEPEITMNKPSLYQTKEDKPRYGTFLIKDSMNRMVLEMRGEGGTVESFAEDDIEVVTPFTVELTRLGIDDPGVNGSIHIIAKKDQLSKDDVILELNSSAIWRVTKVDSKCLTPRDNTSKWMKIPAEFITLGDQ